MTMWRSAGIAEAAKLLESKKLFALAAATSVGVAVPDGRVVMRMPRPDRSLGGAAGDRAPDGWLNALSLEVGKVLIRAAGAPNSPTWRAIVADKAEIVQALEALLVRYPTADCALVQERWQGQDPSRRVVSIDTMLATPSAHDAYQVGRLAEAAGFVDSDPGAPQILETCRRLSPLFGARAKIDFGMDAGSVTFLAAHASDIEADGLARATLDTASQMPAIRPAAIAVFADLERARASAFAFAADAGETICRGRSVGALWASGRVAFGHEAQRRMREAGDPVILMREVLRAEDCDLFGEADGIVSVRDGVSSHYALLAGSLRKACIVDLANAAIDEEALRTPDFSVREGDWVTIDEHNGLLRSGRAVATGSTSAVPDIVLNWANTQRRAGLYVNCEHPHEWESAAAHGVDGVGLCRSERHLLTSREGREALRRIVSSDAGPERAGAVERVCAVLGRSLEDLLVAAAGKPVSYRLLEPAELLADNDGEPSLAGAPAWMLRGEAFRSRYADLVCAQIDCAVRAAADVVARGEVTVELALVVPMVADIDEYAFWARYVRDRASEVEAANLRGLRLKVGAMVETPRATLLAGELAEGADVLLFGTNDLTALVWGAERFAAAGVGSVGKKSPFERFDDTGVGPLMLHASKAAKSRNAAVRLTVCGSHASSAEDCEKLLETGVDGLSCHIHAAPEIALSLARARRSEQLLVGVAPSSSAQAVFQQTMQTAMREILSGDTSTVRQWSWEIASQLCLEPTSVWKFFKRDLTAAWFGAREGRRFASPWNVEAACAYALELAPKYEGRIRYSLFPEDIACRASSELVPSPAEQGAIERAFAALDQQVAMEVFPQQPADRVSFRAVLKGRVMSVEGAAGPAIEVFWKAPRALSKFSFSSGEGFFDRNDANESFVGLFERGVRELYARASSMRDYLGADWVSLEGYAGPSPDASLFIADLDLPLDSVFLVNKPAS